MGKNEQPAGGHEDVPLPKTSGPTYTVKLTFHSATNLPVADYPSASSDPFIVAQLSVNLPQRHPDDPKLRFRSHTVHRTIEPTWEAVWVVAGVPASGFELKTRIYDEDPGNHDDRLGKVYLWSGPIGRDWKGIQRQTYEVKKAGSDLIAYGLRWGRTLVCRNAHLHAQLTLSAEVIGETEEEVGKVYTVNNYWFVHYSPMIGRLAGVKDGNDKGIDQYNFQANEIQLTGPVPNELYHRYVEFKPFVAGMFTAKGIRGRILHKALHHQHERIYNFDKQTKFGTVSGPGDELTLKFLDMVHYDEGGRIFTYVITLDGMFRFTETGKEFGIDLLSKHTMHSDVNVHIACSGEFLIRRLAKPRKGAEEPSQHTHPGEQVADGPPTSDPPEDPKHYELIIDNDSGTYRPDKSLLSVLKRYLKRSFPNLHIVVKACDDERLDKIKEDQRKIKESEGDNLVFGQGSDGSISSSDEEELETRAREEGHVQTGKEKAFEAVRRPAETVKDAVKDKRPGGEGENADSDGTLANDLFEPEGEAAQESEKAN